ncbi:MAG: CatB-related O-acetyltransferase [Quadrisphaera sp.]
MELQRESGLTKTAQLTSAPAWQETPVHVPSAVPDPTQLHPSTRPDLTNVVFLRNQVTSPLTEVGEYTYFDDEGSGAPFETTNVLYHHGPQRLRIGRFTAIAPGVTILMPAGNHPTIGPSTYPFTMFGGKWTKATLQALAGITAAPDTVIGNDVWLGRDATVLPGVCIGDGAIVAAHSVVSKDVPPYAVVAGNPARQVSSRFNDEDITRLLALRWWDWPIKEITRHAAAIMAGTPAELADLAARKSATGSAAKDGTDFRPS